MEVKIIRVFINRFATGLKQYWKKKKKMKGNNCMLNLALIVFFQLKRKRSSSEAPQKITCFADVDSTKIYLSIFFLCEHFRGMTEMQRNLEM